MTQDCLEYCLSALAGMLSPSQPWTDCVGLYTMAIEDWDDEIARQEIRRIALTSKWRPSPAELRIEAARHMAFVRGFLPDIRKTRDDLSYVVTHYGIGVRSFMSPAVNPLLNLTSDHMGGWAVIGRMETEAIDRSFPAAYAEAVKEWSLKLADECLPLKGEGEKIKYLSGQRTIIGALEEIREVRERSQLESVASRQIKPKETGL